MLVIKAFRAKYMMDENTFKFRKEIIDPFVAHLAGSLADDSLFVSEIGLDEFKHEQIILALESIFGFIFSMYKTAKNIFGTRNELTLDEKLIRLIYSRLILLPELAEIQPDMLSYAQECYEQIKSHSGQSQTKWNDTPLYTKFFEICVRVLTEEMYNDRIEDYSNDISSLAHSHYFIRSSIFERDTRRVQAIAFKGLFSHINWELDDSEVEKISRKFSMPIKPYTPDTAQSALKKRGFPDKFVKGLREILGDEKFTSLVVLGEKYFLFDQDFFSNPHSFKDINNEMTKLRVSGFLSHMANELCRRHNLDAGEKLSKIVLTLDPKHFAAYATLALICRDSGRLGEARVYAKRAITGMDSFDEGYRNIPVPEYIANPKHLTAFCDELHSILALTPDEKEIVKEWTPTKEQEKVIEGLDEILKCIGEILCIRYRTMFPADTAHTIVLRASTLLNELVVENLRGEQVRFYRDNSEFVEREKIEVMMLKEVKKGVLDFLVAKGGYYLSSGIPFAELWINKAKKIDTNIDIPKTLKDVQEAIESCLTWYQEHG